MMIANNGRASEMVQCGSYCHPHSRVKQLTLYANPNQGTVMKQFFVQSVGFAMLVCFAVIARADESDEQAAKRPRRGNSAAGEVPPREPSADRILVYKTVDGVELKTYLFLPPGHRLTDKHAAILFFFGGGWTNGSPTQFEEQCKYLASRGMVAMTCDYRVGSRHGVKAIACVRDAKSAVRWARAHATELGIDPERIVASGGSAGGHIAACTGVIDGLDEPTENTEISSQPNAMALFNPALVLAGLKGRDDGDQARIENLRERLGIDPKEISPVHHVDNGEPVTIIFHGKADTTVPYETAVLFTETMKSKGNDCQLVGYEQQGHGFFNYGRRGDGYQATVAELDRFLVRIGYLEPKH